MKLLLLVVAALAACGGESADGGVADGEVAEVGDVQEDAAIEVQDPEDAEVAQFETRDALDGAEVMPTEVTEEIAVEVMEEIAAEVIAETEVAAEVIAETEIAAEVIEDVAQVSDVDASEDVIEIDDGDTTMPEMPEPEVAQEVSDDVAQEVADTVEVVVPPQIDVTPGCNTVFSEVPVVASPHIALCSATAFTTNPPTSGPHYPTWAAFKTYTNPVNPGFLVHSQEHGAVVIHHRCGDVACEAELAQLATFIAGRPADPMCVAPVANRIIVTPSVTIPSRFAVSAWGGMITSDCFDLEALADFIDYYYAKAPENFCSPGADMDTIVAGSALYCPP